MLYEVNANSENWMIAGRKRGYVSLSEEQGKVNLSFFVLILYQERLCILMMISFVGWLKYYRFKSGNIDTMCSISCGLCPSSSARFAKRGRSKCKQQSTRSSLSVRLASTSQFFLLRPCQVVKVVHLNIFHSRLKFH